MSDDEIFFAAIERETKAEQQEVLDSLCDGDSEQHQRVAKLLETHRKMNSPDDDSQSILDRPGVVFRTFSDQSELTPGKRISNYVLQEMIGEGATSLVFRAQQTKPIEREVALKILKPGMDSQRILARFSLEHQVIKRLEHAGITAVFDVGVQDNGRPFFAMELVPNALTITQYADRFHFDLRDRIHLVISTCEIIQHAHQRGIIHRDLKPTNILIEGVPQDSPSPRIIDFGIAKVMQPGEDTSSVTTIGDRFGTPAYMSPEQALMSASSLDIRSDVYSLGVVLYELVTGTTPRVASQRSTQEIPWTSEAYWQYEIKPPSQVHSTNLKSKTQQQSSRQGRLPSRKAANAERATVAVGHELDLIILKAIAKDRHDRYQTVADLQRDLQRFLNGEPVEAAGPGLLYRWRKLVSRNRGVSASIGVVLITIIATSILTTSYAFRTQNAEQQVRNQLQKTLDTQQQLLLERDRAEEAMRQSQSLLRVFQVQSVTDRSLSRFLKQLFESVQRGEIPPQLSSSSDITDQVTVLTKPHERLIVRGDWSWASSQFLTEVVNASFQISSREAAEALSLPQNSRSNSETSTEKSSPSPNQPVEANQSINRESFQHLLLEELRLVLPKNDPFIAEVLDNCGLQALGTNKLDDAQKFLSESVSIWEQCPKYPSNLVQAELFLAETYMRQGQPSLSEPLLKKASQTLGTIPDDAPHRAELHQFYNRLFEELTKSR